MLVGLAALRFLMELRSVGHETTVDHAHRIASRLRLVSGRTAVDLAFVVMLAGYRDVMRGELFATTFGEAQFVGSIEIVDVAGPATFAALLALTVLAIARWATCDASRLAGRSTLEVAGPHGVPPAALWLGYALLLGCVVAIRRYAEAAAGPVVGNTRVILVEAWQCWLAAHLVLGGALPTRSRQGLIDWFRREHRPLSLLLTLEIVRVVSRDDRYRGVAWLSSQTAPLPESLVFLSGRVHDWIGIGVATLMLGCALALWLVAGYRRREEVVA